MIKSKGTAYMLWCISLCGFCGMHRFYLEKYGTGVLWVLTFGVFGIGTLIDLFTLGTQVDVYNGQQEMKEIKKITLANISNDEKKLK